LNQPAPDESRSQRSVLAILGSRTGLAPKVLLPDSNSEHGTSPLVQPGSPASKLVPQGRGNYQLLGEIARGGMGVILKGHDTDLGRDVAVKVLDGELAKRPEVVQRFVEEAQIGGQLQHPGIVPVYELGLMADDCPYFTMKLVKGHTLAALFKQRKSPADNRGRCSRSSSRSARPWPTRTRRACCTATSSRRTSWWGPSARCRSSTGASPRCCAAAAWRTRSARASRCTP